ncbi:MAG: glycosyltransferase, partial [Acidimicrobiales bacterium]
MPPRRVLVVTTDPLTENMPGPAIRAWHLAEVLSTSNDVILVSTVAADRTHLQMSVGVAPAGPDRDELETWAEVVVIPAGVFYEWPSLARPELVVVVDAYDPYHLENLEPGATSDIVERDEQVGRLTTAISAHLARADLVLCATSRQRDFWLGTLAAIGRVNPYTYDQDPTFRSLVTLVPFGMPAEPPERRGRGLRESLGVVNSDRVILWGGGVYDWFDPLTLIKAVDRLARRMSGVRLVFMGMSHPN